jgi:hypothetical protein
MQDKLKGLIYLQRYGWPDYLQEEQDNKDIGSDRLKWLESELEIKVYNNHLTIVIYNISHRFHKSIV